MDIKKHVADRIKHYRKLKNLSQEALALDIGVSKPMVQRLESGIHWPRLENLAAIAKRLDVEVSDFFTGLPPARPTPEQALEVIKAHLSQAKPHTAPALVTQDEGGQGLPSNVPPPAERQALLSVLPALNQSQLHILLHAVAGLFGLSTQEFLIKYAERKDDSRQKGQ